MQEVANSRRNTWRQWIWTVGFALALATLTVLVLQAWRSARRAEAMREFLTHTGQVLGSIHELEALAAGMESSQRGFLITGSRELLAARDREYAQLQRTVAELRRMLRADRDQSLRLREAEDAVHRRHARMLAASSTAAREGLGAARATFDPNSAAGFAPVRSRLARLRDAEQQRLVRYTQEVGASARRLNDLITFGALFALALLLVSGVALWLQMRRGEALRLALARSDALQRSVLENAGQMVIATDPQGVITLFNHAAREQLGYEPAELTGRHTPRIFHLDTEVAARARELSAELRETVDPGFEVFVAKARRGTTDVARWTYVRRDGSQFRVQLAVSAVRDPQGELLGFVGLAQDVTDHELAHERLRLSEQRVRTVIDTASDAFVAINSDGLVEDWNSQAEHTFGWPRAEALGRPLAELIIPARFRDAHNRGLQRYLETGHGPVLNRRIEISALDRGGREFPIELTIWPTRSGEQVSFNAFVQDITERKAAQDAIRKLNAELAGQARELADANRELEGFSYSVSHDLRAPLRHMSGYAQILREDAGDRLDPSLLRYIDEISASARRMGALIDDLLAFSRLGRQSMTPIAIDMNAVVSDALGEADLAQNPQARIEVAPLPAARGDPVLLRQVWTNLLSNAMKYSAPRGAEALIRVEGEHDGNVVRYRVRDNGVGFDPRYADKLFGVFQRLHSQDEFEGTGVGLAIVQRIVARHHGRVTATSQPGEGAEFVFEIPQSPEEVPA